MTAPVTSQPIVAALDAAVTAAGVAFGDGLKPTDATTRYVVAWFPPGKVEDSSLRSRDGFSVVGTFHCYGQTTEAARIANRVLTEAILSLRGQIIGGRQLMAPEQLSDAWNRDDDLTPPMFDAISEWRFGTTPA